MKVTGALAFVSVVLLGLSGTVFVLMGLALRRAGRPRQFLSLSFNPAERLRIARRVIEGYLDLKRERGTFPILYYLLCVCIGLAVACVGLTFASMAWAGR